MMRKIVGVDLSLTATGIGIITQTSTGYVASVAELKTKPEPTGKLNAKGKPTECVRDRVMRSREIARDVWMYAHAAELLVIEGLFNSPNAASLVDRGATWMRVLDRCVINDIPYAVIQPTALKKPIAETGGASKTEMISALLRLWPEVTLKTDNEVDALAMAHLGAVALGWEVPTLARHKVVTWTEFPEDLLDALTEDAGVA